MTVTDDPKTAEPQSKTTIAQVATAQVNPAEAAEAVQDTKRDETALVQTLQRL